MTLLFDRKYSLKVGLPLGTQVIDMLGFPVKDGTTRTDFQNNGDFRTVSVKRAVEITDLQITANIKSNSNSTSSTSKTIISIYNLSKATLDIVAKNLNYVILEAGYAQDEKLEMVFSGQVETHVTTRQGQDLVTELTCTDAYTPNNYVKISKKFDNSKTYGDILTYLVDQYADNGITIGEFVDDWGDVERREPSVGNGVVLAAKGIPQDYAQLPVLQLMPANTKALTGMVLTGYLHQALDKVCAQIGYVNYITCGRLFVHPKGYTKMVEQFELSTNIMKSIRPMGSKATGGSLGKGIEGISITTFLDGRLDVDKSIKILDGDHAGEYKIITKEHKLDYEGGSWDTLLTCTKFD